MRVMAYVGTLIFGVAALGAFLYWRRRLESTRWFLWAAVGAIPLPFIACLAGWVLTEVGRQPWIVQGLLKTVGRELAERGHRHDRRSASASSSRSTLLLGVVDFVLMRRYARVDPPEPEDGAGRGRGAGGGLLGRWTSRPSGSA